MLAGKTVGVQVPSFALLTPLEDNVIAGQPCILEQVPLLARSLTFDARVSADPRPALAKVRALLDPSSTLAGIGAPLARVLQRDIPGLRSFPLLAVGGVSIPVTQGALWINLHAGDRGSLDDRAHLVIATLAESFRLTDDTECFRYREGRDLSGYEDGTENPTGDKAKAAVFREDGSSFVAVQKWVHDLAWFTSRPDAERDAIIGRRASDNTEIVEADVSAHVKRSAQESFDPEAFMVRRSMPWMTDSAKGLLFIAYGESLDRYERVLERMIGLEDGIVDGLFHFSRPTTGGYFFCPPLRGGQIDL
ncbi:Dyp-type peroxidase [soil metagenome]